MIKKKSAILFWGYFILFIGIALLFAETAAISEIDLSGIGTNHAVIIGISKYDHWPDLESPVKDAEAIRDILIAKYGFKEANITLLTDHADMKPTAVNILQSFNSCLSTLTGRDNLLVFFSGRSEEDGNNTYWLPSDAQKIFKTNWLNHSELCDKIFASKKLKVKNLCILTDSFFSEQLLNVGEFVPLYPFDLRYPEKIIFKNKKKSRQVISFNTHHFPPNKTGGLGVFTYYIRKALLANRLKITDIENLVFDESVSYPIRRITGTKMKHGRLRGSMDENGQFILVRSQPLPPINVDEVIVTPSESSFPDVKRTIEARIKHPDRVKDVYIEFSNQRHPMRWNGFTWEYDIIPDKPGEIPFKLYALNDDNIPGPPVGMGISTVKRPAELTKILSAEVKIKKGTVDTFIFSALTDQPAEALKLSVNGQAYKMQGKGTQWALALKIPEYGKMTYSMVALNEEGAESLPTYGTFYVKPPLVNVINLTTDRKVSHPQDVFMVRAETDRPAQGVVIKIDGQQYDMNGADEDWYFDIKLSEIGKKTIVATAQNSEGESGSPAQTDISITPHPRADVVDISTPVHIYADAQFIIRAKTDEPAKGVMLTIDEARFPMVRDGSDKEWKCTVVIKQFGSSRLTAIAENKSSVRGGPFNKTIRVEKHAARPINIANVSLAPKTGFPGQIFKFNIKTDRPAKEVVLSVEGRTHQMLPADTTMSDWHLSLKFSRPGDKGYTIVANNQIGIQGSPWVDRFKVSQPPVKVSDVRITPEAGFIGEVFKVSVKTSRPANKVYLRMDGEKHVMQGSGKEWTFQRKRRGVGTKEIIVIAENSEGTQRMSKPLITTTEKRPLPEITSVRVTPEKIVSGDKINIKASTMYDAHNVYIDIDGIRHEMQGSGKNWYYEEQTGKAARVLYRVMALNENGEAAAPYSGQLLILKPPASLVNVTECKVNPSTGFPSRQFTFSVKTDRSAEGVALVFDDGRYKMSGSRKEWRFTRQFNTPGSIRFYAVAINEDRKEGLRKWDEFTVLEMKDRYKLIDSLTVLDQMTQKKINRFIDNGNGTITDLSSSLMWLKSPYTVSGQTYKEAVDYCRNLTYKGLSGWRLPNIDEFKKLLPALSSPGHPFEEVTLIFPYWTKTPQRGRVYMKTMDLKNGLESFQEIKKQGYVWPVRYVDLNHMELANQ